MVLYEKPKALIRRVPTIEDTTDKVQRFDSDNLYPQRAEEILKRSVSLKSLYARIADFINGQGFADKTLGTLIVNKQGLKGESLNKVLSKVSKIYGRYSTVCLHLGYNAEFKICAINVIPFEYIRLGLKDKFGRVFKYGYSNNWERDARKANERNIVFYDKFNPDPAVVQAQMLAQGGVMKYIGQILYHTPVEDQYPLAEFDAVFDDAQTQGELAMFRIGQVQNSFLGTTAIVYPGKFASADEEAKFNRLIQGKSGSRGAGGIIGLQDPTGTKKANEIFQNLSPTSLDKQFELTERTVKDNIIQSEAFPPILLGISPNGLFAQSEMEEAYQYVNTTTRNRRANLAEVFSNLMEFWMDPIITDASILTLQYITDDATGSAGITINDNLQNMSGKQAQNFERILRKYGNGLYKRPVAEKLLQDGFGLSSEEIAKLLDGLDQLKAEDATTPVALKPKYKAFVSEMVNVML
jgi:hypothetical protein